MYLTTCGGGGGGGSLDGSYVISKCRHSYYQSSVKPGVKTPITVTDHERINIFHTATLVRTMMEVVEEEVEVEEVTLVSLSLQYSRHC